MLNTLLWVAFPYVAATMFVGGHVWRYRRDRFAFTRGPAGDSRLLRWGAATFRLGVVTMIAGHVGELCCSGHDLWWTIFFLVGAAAAVAGVMAALIQRITAPPQPGTRSPVDRVVLPLLATALMTGVIARFDSSPLGINYLPRQTIIPWVRSVLSLHPRPELMAHAPVICQLRAVTVLIVVAIWPFTRMVHVFAGPVLEAAQRLATRQRPAVGSGVRTPRPCRHYL